MSGALEALAEFGAEHFLSREQLAHVDIADLLRLRGADHRNVAATVRALAESGGEAFAVQQSFCLPDQIFSPSDIASFEYRRAMPNYVTQARSARP